MEPRNRSQLQFTTHAVFFATTGAAFLASAWAAGVVVPVALLTGLVFIVFATLFHLAKPLGMPRTAPTESAAETSLSLPASLATCACIALAIMVNALVVRVPDAQTACFGFTAFAVAWIVLAIYAGCGAFGLRNKFVQIALCLLAIVVAVPNVCLSALLMFAE